jgi:hypothetical protein
MSNPPERGTGRLLDVICQQVRLYPINMKETPRKSESVRSTSLRSLAELLKPYRSGWVALSSDEQEIVASGETLHETRERVVRSRSGNDAIFVKVIPPEQGYLPLFQ